MIYAFWNNKGGTGKTSLIFQAACRYAEIHQNQRVLAIDLCPQANLSELLLGGIEGGGGANLAAQQAMSPRRTIAGYFQTRLPAAFTVPAITTSQFLITPSSLNVNVPGNIDLLPGDALVELQANAISTLANTQIPGTDTWLAVIDWLRDFLHALPQPYDAIFIDTNPSFSLYTQIGLAASDRVVFPVTADDSSRRGLQNAFCLIHGIAMPSARIYSAYTFSSRLAAATPPRTLPKVHLIVKNRLTQYMGSASAYASILSAIDTYLSGILASHPSIFTFSSLSAGIVEVRDFQTTGVVAFAKGTMFSRINVGYHTVQAGRVQLNEENIQNCRTAVDGVVSHL